MGCVQSYFRKAHKAGLSPSSTQDSENAGLVAASPTDPAKLLLAETPLPTVDDVITTSPAPVTPPPVAEREVPNGHAPAPQSGLGLLGPGIAALAASTGTVAILGAAADTTIEEASQKVEDAGKGVDAFAGKAEAAVMDLGKDVKQQVSSLVDDSKSTMKELGNDVQKEGESVVDTAKKTVTDATKFVDNSQKGLTTFVQNAKETLVTVGVDVQKKGESALDKTKESVDDAKREVKQAQKEIGTFADKSKEAIDEMGKDIKKEGEVLVETAKGKVNDADDFAENAKKSLEAFGENTTETVVDFGKEVKGEVVDFGKEVKGEVVDFGKEVKGEGESLIVKGREKIDDAGKLIQDEGEALTGKAKDAIESVGNNVQKGGETLVDKAKETIGNVEKEVEGAQKGMETFVQNTKENLNEMGKDAETEMASLTDKTKDALENLGNNVTEVKQEVGSSVKAAAKSITEDTVEKVKSEVNAVSETVESLVVEDDLFPAPPPPVGESLGETISNKSAYIIADDQSETKLRAKRSVSESEETDDSQPTSTAANNGEIIESTNQSRPTSIVDHVVEISLPEVAVGDAKSASQKIEALAKEASGLGEKVEKEIDQESTNSPERALSRAELCEEKAEEVVNDVVKTVTELVTKSATTIQATFRGHQARLTMKKPADQTAPEVNEDVVVASRAIDTFAQIENESSPEVPEDIFPPPPDDSDSDLLSGIVDKGLSDTLTTDETSSADDKYNQQIINVTINRDVTGSSPTSLAESDKASDVRSDVLSTVPAESEPESLDAFLIDGNRAVSIVSESTVSIGDSIGALKGSETDSVGGFSVSEDAAASTPVVVNEDERLGMAATKIQASYRGFHARQNLRQTADDAQLPLPEPLPFTEPTAALDEDDLPPPPDECDIEPPPPLEIDEDGVVELVDTPRSPETGEKTKNYSAVPVNNDQVSEMIEIEVTTEEEQARLEAEQLAMLQRPQVCDELPEHRGGIAMNDGTRLASSEDQVRLEAEQLALLQRPQVCDELPEHRGVNVDKDVGIEDVDHEVHEVLRQSLESVTTSDHRDDLVNGVARDAPSSAEVDDSSLSSAATKIQAGARGYLSRKLIKDTFSTTAPSITDSFTDDGVHTSDSLETEVQRQSMEEQNVGVTAVVISTGSEHVAAAPVENGISHKVSEVTSGKGRSLDSQLPDAANKNKKKPGLTSSTSLQNHDGGGGMSEEDRHVWETLQSGMEDAATKIQSNFRGYRTRQRLHRENAVQMPTTSSGTPATTIDSDISDAVSCGVAGGVVRSSGEFHDMIVLPTTPADGNVQDSSVPNDGLARRQTSTVGKRRRGSDVTATPASHTGGGDAREECIIKMGKAAAKGATEEHQARAMKAEHAANAATKIQAGFRGYKVRKQMRDLQRAGVKKNGPRRRRSSNSATAVQQAASLPHARRESRDSITKLQERSATTIQAGIRGFLVRKRRQEEKKAAVKIQAGFRGYQVRRNVKTRAPVEK